MAASFVKESTWTIPGAHGRLLSGPGAASVRAMIRSRIDFAARLGSVVARFAFADDERARGDDFAGFFGRFAIGRVYRARSPPLISK